MCGRFYIKKDFSQVIRDFFEKNEVYYNAAPEEANSLAFSDQSASPGASLGANSTEASGRANAKEAWDGSKLLQSFEEPRDVFPSELSLTVSGSGGRLVAANMQWGYTLPGKKNLLINARSETAGEKPTFADSLRRRRCVIPASGYYEWDQYKMRYRFTASDEKIIWLAGIYRREQDALRYTILTAEANDVMMPVHDRMPVTIRPGDIRSWIFDNSKTQAFLCRKQEELRSIADEGQIRMDIWRVL